MTSATAVSDATGQVSTNLIATSFASGDNYIVEATLDPEMATNPNFVCGSTCSKTGVITAWKRVYLEVDEMFTRGAFVTAKAPPGSTFLIVSDLALFRDGDVIRINHAPPRQHADGQPASSSDPLFNFYSEEKRILVRNNSTQHADGTILPPHLELVDADGSPSPLDHYFGPDLASSFEQLAFLGDAVGVISGSQPEVYTTDRSLLKDAFADSYVDMVELESTVREIPYVRLLGNGERAHFGYKWSDAAILPGAGTAAKSRNNHQYLAGATRVSDQTNPAGQIGALLGVTPNTGIHQSWIWIARIRAATNEQNQPIYMFSPQTVQREVVVHEMTHQWHVNPTAPANSLGHCPHERYQKDGKYCLMHTPYYNHAHNSELGDDEVSLHYEVSPSNNSFDSEYLTIRRASEPLYQP